MFSNIFLTAGSSADVAKDSERTSSEKDTNSSCKETERKTPPSKEEEKHIETSIKENTSDIKQNEPKNTEKISSDNSTISATNIDKSAKPDSSSHSEKNKTISETNRQTMPLAGRRKSSEADLQPPVLECQVPYKKPDRPNNTMSTDDSLDENRLVIDENVDVESMDISPVSLKTPSDKDVSSGNSNKVTSPVTEEKLSEKERAWNELRMQRQREKFNEFINRANAKPNILQKR